MLVRRDIRTSASLKVQFELYTSSSDAHHAVSDEVISGARMFQIEQENKHGTERGPSEF